MIRKTLLSVMLSLPLAGCTKLGDPNERPTYGKTGLPKNCRAIIQANVDGYRAHQYSADDVIASIERNCGANGYSWGQ